MTLLLAGARLLGALAVAGAAGAALSRRLHAGLSAGERLAWSAAAGLLAQAALYGLLLAIGVKPAAPLLLSAEALAALIALGIRGQGSARERTASPRGARSVASVIVFGVCAAAVAAFALQALSEPLWSNDYLAIWGLKGKTIYTAGAIPGRLFHDPTLAFSHPEYPLLLPLLFASSAASAGAWNGQALALLYPVLEVATLAAVFGFVRRRSGRRGALASVLTVALCFPLYRPFHAGLAEIPFAFFAVLAGEAFLEAARSLSPAVSGRAVLASLGCVAIKQEGALLVLLLAAVLLWRPGPRLRERCLGAASFAGLALAHFGAMFLLRGPIADRDFDLMLLAPGQWHLLPARFGSAAASVAMHALAPAAPGLAAAILFLILTPRSPGDRLVPVVVAQAAIYGLACAFALPSPEWLVRTAFSRICLALLPMAALVLGERWNAAFPLHSAARA